MRILEIQIATDDPTVVDDLLRTATDALVMPPGAITVRALTAPSAALELQEVVSLMIEVASSIACGMVGGLGHRRVRTVVINRIEVKLEHGSLERVVVEQLEYQEAKEGD
jgi:hypothetical protein